MVSRLFLGLALLGSGAARADTLAEDAIRRTTVQHDEQFAVEVSAGWAQAVGDGGVDVFMFSADWHIFRALALSAGVYDLPDRGSEGGFFLGLEANPIGVGPVQTCVGVDGLFGDSFHAAYYAGLRVETGRIRISPRVFYTVLTDDEGDDRGGWGAGVTVSFALFTTAP